MILSDNSQVLPPIPERRYFTIGEASSLCEVKPHVLRYWEQEFPQLSPSKRRGNRRYYQRDDVLLIREIKDLLHIQGYTINGARGLLTNSKENNHPASKKTRLRDLADELDSIIAELQEDPLFHSIN